MSKEHKWTPLKLRAIDDSDLIIFSECIFEGIILPSEIDFNANDKQFAMALERFTWESAMGKDYNLMQVLSILIVEGVKKVEIRNNFKENSINHLKSISNVDNNILILLNDDQIINLKVGNWSCMLRDIGEPWFPATTPSHFNND